SDLEENQASGDESQNRHQVETPENLGVYRLSRFVTVFPLELEVMVQRRPQEKAPADFVLAELFRDLEPADLQKHRYGLGQEYHSHNGQEQFDIEQDEHHADGASEPDGTGIAHVNLGGRTVIPQIGQHGADDGRADREKLVAPGNIGNEEIFGEDGVSG